MKNWEFSQKIINWQHTFGRNNLPWQIHNNIYRTWISEIMLQQTQVKTVIPYFNKFTSILHNVEEVSKSTLDIILYLWSGLGYYTRAKNIYKTAQIIMNQYQGHFPKNIFILMKLPGIGRTTAGAILSLTYNFSFPILDGNIKRILNRFYDINLHDNKTKIEKKLWNIITTITPIHNAKKFNQGMMDLGSLICHYKIPKCFICPIKDHCKYQKKNINKKKNKNKKKILKKIYKFFILLRYKNHILLEKRKENKIWNYLFCFPEFQHIQDMEHWIYQYNMNLKYYYNSHNIYHQFTHVTLKMIIINSILKNKKQILQKKNYIWYNLNKSQKIGIPAPIKKILLNLKKI